MTEEPTIDSLIGEYQRWIQTNQLQHISGDASDLIMRAELTQEQVIWLSDFIERWDQAEEVESGR